MTQPLRYVYLAWINFKKDLEFKIANNVANLKKRLYHQIHSIMFDVKLEDDYQTRGTAS
jgi:hypothetical protein